MTNDQPKLAEIEEAKRIVLEKYPDAVELPKSGLIWVYGDIDDAPDKGIDWLEAAARIQAEQTRST